MLNLRRICLADDNLNEVVAVGTICEAMFVEIVFGGAFHALLFGVGESAIGAAEAIAGLGSDFDEDDAVLVLGDQVDFSPAAAVFPGPNTESLPAE